MSSKLSVSQVVSSLEERLAFLQEKAAFHAEQEAHHREQREAYAAEMERVEARLDTFRSAAESMDDLAELLPGQKKAEPPDLGPGRPKAAKVIRAVVETFGEGERFGANGIAAEANRRHRDKLDAPLDGRTVSVVLRRMRSERRIHLVRPGKPNYEALYARGPKPKE